MKLQWVVIAFFFIVLLLVTARSIYYHPNRYGSYLKACVNYLILFGEPFGDNPADCEIPHDIAVRLRQAATEIVFGKQ